MRPQNSLDRLLYYCGGGEVCALEFGTCAGAFAGAGVAFEELVAAASSDGLYFGALTYPCTRSLPMRFTTTCVGCESFSVWIQIGSYRFTFFLFSSLSSTIIAISKFLRFASALRKERVIGPMR